jgi:sec-independent protein translocase protein TatB
VPFLSPAKLLVILVVAVVVMGPERLPKVAKQIGSLWGDFRKFREKVESEVRGNFPDLPSTHTINQAVRSPLSFLDNLAETRNSENGTTSAKPEGLEPPDAEVDGIESSESNGPPHIVSATQYLSTEPGAGPSVHSVRPVGSAISEDPAMN